MVKHNNSCGRYRLFEATRMSRRQMIACCVMAMTIMFGTAVQAQGKDTVRTLDEVMIQDVRVSNKAPLTTSNIDRQQLDEARASVSVPYMLETQTSVVTTGENGTVGATTMRIRGVDASRINVNINGITLNDPESQSVFWYNIPNIGGMAQSMQIQRGVGASTGGSPAFGAAINLQTLNAQSKAYGEADLGYGSWNTRQYSISAGSGILKSGLSFDLAYSGLTSDGFLRGGQTDQQSFFGSASWYGKRTLIKLLTIIGSQTTGVTWNGADTSEIRRDRRYNSAGMYYMDADTTFDSWGDYTLSGDTSYYPRETDNYWQRHYQLYVSHMFNDNWSINGALDFTHGDGYYEQYKMDAKYKKKLFIPISGKGDYTTRKYMDNNAVAGNLALRYNKGPLSLSVGDNLLWFDGFHYGHVLWFRDTAIHYDTPYEWYRYNGTKTDNSVYIKANYDFNDNLNAYADLQLRMVNYKLRGSTDDPDTAGAQTMLDFDENYLFFNPKAGINWRLDDHQRTYFVAGISHREPTKSDIKEAIANADTVKAEAMLDLELGYQIAHERWAFNANLYAMLYKDQLTPSGDRSSSGYALMENVAKSYRIGIELEGGYEFTKWFRMDANLTLSDNKVVDFTYSDFADGDSIMLDASGNWSSLSVTRNTPLALSPSVVGAAIATFTPVKDAKLQLIGKYVGKQYADNTGRECYAVDPYFVLNIRASYVWHLRGTNEIEAQLLVNNVLDNKYNLHAWAEDWVDDYSSTTRQYYHHSRGWLQQPGINFMGRVIYWF